MTKSEYRLHLAAIEARLARTYAASFKIHRARAVSAGAKGHRGAQAHHMRNARRSAEQAYEYIRAARERLARIDNAKPKLYLIK